MHSNDSLLNDHVIKIHLYSENNGSAIAYIYLLCRIELHLELIFIVLLNPLETGGCNNVYIVSCSLLEEIYPHYYIHSDVSSRGSILQPHDSVLPVARVLTNRINTHSMSEWHEDQRI